MNEQNIEKSESDKSIVWLFGKKKKKLIVRQIL